MNQTFDNSKKQQYQNIMNRLSQLVIRRIEESENASTESIIEDVTRCLNEDDLFFDRQQQLMSPFEPDGIRYSGGGGTGHRNKFYEEM